MTKKTGTKQEKTGKTVKPKEKKEPVKRNADGTFPAGKSGNPNGRPREKSLTTQLKEALKGIEKSTGEDFGVLLVKRLMEKAISGGDMKAITYIFDRLDGRPKQGIELGGLDGDPIEYKVTMTKLTEQINRMDSEWFDDDEDEPEEEKTEEPEVTT